MVYNNTTPSLVWQTFKVYQMPEVVLVAATFSQSRTDTYTPARLFSIVCECFHPHKRVTAVPNCLWCSLID